MYSSNRGVFRLSCIRTRVSVSWLTLIISIKTIVKCRTWTSYIWNQWETCIRGTTIHWISGHMYWFSMAITGLDIIWATCRVTKNPGFIKLGVSSLSLFYFLSLLCSKCLLLFLQNGFFSSLPFHPETYLHNPDVKSIYHSFSAYSE